VASIVASDVTSDEASDCGGGMSASSSWAKASTGMKRKITSNSIPKTAPQVLFLIHFSPFLIEL
jgi:hypothetical protein